MLSRVNDRLPDDKKLAIYVCNAGYSTQWSSEESFTCDNCGQTNDEVDAEWIIEGYGSSFDKWFQQDGKHIGIDLRLYLSEFHRIFNLSGDKSARKVDLQKTYEWGRPVDETIDSDGKVVTYKKSILTIWPKKFEFYKFLEWNTSKTLAKFFESVGDATDFVLDKKTREELKFLVDFIRTRLGFVTKSLTSKQRETMVRLLMQLDEIECLSKFFQALGAKFPTKAGMDELLIVLSQYERADEFIDKFFKFSVRDLAQNCSLILVRYFD